MGLLNLPAEARADGAGLPVHQIHEDGPELLRRIREFDIGLEPCTFLHGSNLFHRIDQANHPAGPNRSSARLRRQSVMNSRASTGLAARCSSSKRSRLIAGSLTAGAQEVRTVVLIETTRRLTEDAGGIPAGARNHHRAAGRFTKTGANGSARLVHSRIVEAMGSWIPTNFCGRRVRGASRGYRQCRSLAWYGVRSDAGELVFHHRS